MRSTTSSETFHSAHRHLDLDAAVVAQTKVQIGTLVSEIAEFAKHCESPSVFYPAMLSRLVTAMAATGAAVWQQSDNGCWLLIQSFNLPDSLISHSETEQDFVSCDRKPSLEHLALLECVSRERQPILVPPGDIAASRDRPTNPLQQCLIYSPIPFDSAKNALWLQVVQPPSGGIATQRGYLRFVAQIADLTADFLKTFRLKQFENESRLYSATQKLLADAATSGVPSERLTNMLLQLRDFAGADQIFLVHRTSTSQRWQVAMATGLRDFDPRSEGSQCIAEFCSWVVPKTTIDQPWMYHAPDRRSDGSTVQETVSDKALPRARFMATFSAASVAWLPLFGGNIDTPIGVGCIAYWSWPTKNTGHASLETLSARTRDLGKMGLTILRPPSLRYAIECSTLRTLGLSRRIQEWLAFRWMRFAVAVVALAGIAMVPVPLRIVAPAVLQPQQQHLHYAPLDARVVKVHVDYGEAVAKGQVLLELEDRNLSNLLDEANSQHLQSKERQRDIEARLLRSDRLPNDVRDELEGELETLRALSGNELQRIEALKKQLDLLAIRSSEDGVVATWNARQLLQDRPVRAGQMLLLVQQPEGPWCIEARLPQKDVGKFLKSTEQGMPIAHGTLSSHPNQPIRAVYQPHNKPVVLSNHLDSNQQPTLGVRFVVSSSELPQKNAGSSAQISIDIGRGSFGWSLFGDALTALWAKVRLWI